MWGRGERGREAEQDKGKERGFDQEPKEEIKEEATQ